MRVARAIVGPGAPANWWVAPGRLSGTLSGSPSKSYTHRALLAGLLSQGRMTIRNPLASEDTVASLGVTRALGATVVERPGGSRLSWDLDAGQALRPVPRARRLWAGESGTTLRLFTPASALPGSPARWEGEDSLARRPMGPLLQALTELGAEVRPPPPGRGLPFRVRGPLSAGTVTLPGSLSSQFLSALLFALAGLPSASRVRVVGPQVSQPYVEASLRVLRAFGVNVRPGPAGYRVPADSPLRPVPVEVPADASSAAYLFAGAALTGGTVRVGPFPTGWPQADLALLPVLRRCGAQVVRRGQDWEVTGGPLPLRPFQADLDASPDLAPLLAVLASFGRGRSRLTGGAQLVHKESDRRRGTEALVRALRARIRRGPAGWEIAGPPLARRLRLLDLSDHRLLFSAAVAALALPGPSVLGPGSAAAKSYPRFFPDLGVLGISLHGAGPGGVAR